MPENGVDGFYKEMETLKSDLLTLSEVATVRELLISSYLAQAASKVSAAMQQYQRSEYLKREHVHAGANTE